MIYTAKKYENLLGIKSLSDKLLQNHFTLYQGYVTNFNKLNDILVTMEKEGKFGTPEYGELNRRLGWEFNGMRLHEYYFENLAKKEQHLRKNFPLAKAIEQEWGSLETFEKDFKSMAAMRGIGWVILYFDKAADRLFNIWINEHDVGHPTGCRPLLVIDVFEHAYMLDYGLKKPVYIEAFWKIIDWEKVEKRLSQKE